MSGANERCWVRYRDDGRLYLRWHRYEWPAGAPEPDIITGERRLSLGERLRWFLFARTPRP
jgi:hypothetical protein